MNLISPYLAVAIGGALGAVSRFALSQLLALWSFAYPPMATLIANLVGCFLLGLLLSLWERQVVGEFYRLFLMVGFTGALTTFSTFSAEFIMFIDNGQILQGFSYLVVSITLGVMLFALAYYGVRQL